MRLTPPLPPHFPPSHLRAPAHPLRPPPNPANVHNLRGNDSRNHFQIGKHHAEHRRRKERFLTRFLFSVPDGKGVREKRGREPFVL